MDWLPSPLCHLSRVGRASQLSPGMIDLGVALLIYQGQMPQEHRA